MSSATIRDASFEDIEGMLLVEQTGYQFPWSEKVFQDCFKDNYFVLVLVESAQIVGFSIVSNIVGEAHLLNICVHKSFSRQGYGTLLLNATVRRAITESCDSMLLEVRESNEGAKAMYEKFGFSMIGRRKNYYPSEDGREDALMYQLLLADESIDQYA